MEGTSEKPYSHFGEFEDSGLANVRCIGELFPVFAWAYLWIWDIPPSEIRSGCRSLL